MMKKMHRQPEMHKLESPPLKFKGNPPPPPRPLLTGAGYRFLFPVAVRSSARNACDVWGGKL